MRKLFLIILLSTLSAGFIITDSFAGAWTAKQNSFYEKAAYNYYYSDTSYDSDGKKNKSSDGGKFTDYNISNYFEYGIIDDITVFNSFSYKFLEKETDESIKKNSGFGDVDLGLRYKILDNKIGIVSVQGLGKFPGLYKKDAKLPLGNGQYDGEAKLLFGRSLYPLLPGYFNIEAGYRWRAEDPSDEIRYLVELGFDIYKGLNIRAKLDGIKSRNNGSKKDSSGNPTSTNNFDLGKIEATLGYKVTSWWGIETSYTRPLYGKDTAYGVTYSGAVYFKYE